MPLFCGFCPPTQNDAEVFVGVEWSVMTMTMTPFCAYQKRELNELGGMRGQQNQLRQSVNQLQTENNILTTSVDQLELNVNQ